TVDYDLLANGDGPTQQLLQGIGKEEQNLYYRILTSWLTPSGIWNNAKKKMEQGNQKKILNQIKSL
ncbi:hypothetical protein ATANTOWER_022246, partial [Ataeniobius toweri]|nr:hypothetical protein [Ataeniobius toweri]